jgi:hypothetical protein
LPLSKKIGIAWNPKINRSHYLTMTGELSKTKDTRLRGNIGLEYWYKMVFAVRTGLKIGYDIETWTIGVGVNFKNCQLDYAFLPSKTLNDKYRISLLLRF